MQKARDKIEHAEKLIKELRKQQGYLEIRLEQEKREIKALKHELEVMHIARDLPVPKVRSLRGTGLRGGWRRGANEHVRPNSGRPVVVFDKTRQIS